MQMRRQVLSLLLSLFLISTGSAASDVLLNGTNIYLATGDSYGLYQGYILNLKSVSSDGSVWLQLDSNDQMVKSEIVSSYGSFVYNKSNRTILSIKVDRVYSGSSDQALVSFLLYQFKDPDMPLSNQSGTLPSNTHDTGNDESPRLKPPREPVIWALGIFSVLSLIYILRKLW